MSVLVQPAPGADERPVTLSPAVVVRLAGRRLELERLCGACAGAGYVPVVVRERCGECGGLGYDDLAGELACGVCEGRGERDVEGMEQCGRCDGTGLELTTEGRRLLIEAGPELWRFLRRWRRA